jgi:hypothetical protein
VPALSRAASRAAFLILTHGPVIAAGLIGLLAFALYFRAAFAFDSEKWGHDPETSAWFESLHNSHGTSCCDYADGVRLEDPNWFEAGGGEYAVFAQRPGERGKWITVPADRVLTGTNRVGYAILWWPHGWPEPSCFLPGARG